MQERYHLTFNTVRTTITVDSILAEMLAIKLGHDPATPEARASVRKWLQQEWVEAHEIPEIHIHKSQWARRTLIEEIADKKILKKWNEWYCDFY